MKCFIVFWQHSTTHHFFDTYEEAERYLVLNNLGRGAVIARLLATGDSKTTIKKVNCMVANERLKDDKDEPKEGE